MARVRYINIMILSQRCIVHVSTVQILREGHRIWKKLPPFFEITYYCQNKVGDFFQNFVAFLEYLNFTYNCVKDPLNLYTVFYYT
jgi:hypothetical protein